MKSDSRDSRQNSRPNTSQKASRKSKKYKLISAKHVGLVVSLFSVARNMSKHSPRTGVLTRHCSGEPKHEHTHTHHIRTQARTQHEHTFHIGEDHQNI